MLEPELIEIIEGPAPEFRPSPQSWLQSIHEGPDIREVVMCQLRTASGKAIVERSERAWKEHRPVKLDFADEMLNRHRVDVIALRLSEVDEGQLLSLWVSLPIDFTELEEVEDFYDDDFDDFDDLDDEVPL